MNIENTRTHSTLCLTMLMLLLLSACGGSSGGSSDDDTTADRAWGSAMLIDSEDLGDATSPQIAVDGSGNALSVWQQFDGAHFNIWANHFDGSSWGSAELISLGIRDARTPQIGFDGSGNAIALWQRFDTVKYILRSRNFDGSSWGSAGFNPSSHTIGDSDFPQIAVDDSGNALAVWEHFDGVRTNIRANRFDGSNWGFLDELIETDNAGDATSPQIAGDGSGNALAVWQQSDGVRLNIWANRFDGSSWGSAELIESDNAGGAFAPQIAADDSGNALAVWTQSDGTRNNIWANRFDGSSWGSAVLIETDNTGTAVTPQIAVDGSGNALAVWAQSDGTRESIWANRFDGSSWGSAVLIETDNTASASAPQIAVDDSGNALAVWRQSDGTTFNIYANRFDGSSWGSAVLIENDDTGDARDPQIAVEGNGDAVAVWRQSDGTRFNIWANRFE